MTAGALLVLCGPSGVDRRSSSAQRDLVFAISCQQLTQQKFDPGQFCRIHRSTLLNLAWVREVDAWFGGRVLVRLKDTKGTELQVARDRVGELKKRLGI